jgi:predicted PurR-regulated permease PerM
VTTVQNLLAERQEGLTGTRVRAAALVVATAAGLIVCYQLARPFLPPLAWALALAVVGAPMHRRIESMIGRPNVAATVSVVILASAVLVPTALVAERLVSEVGKATAAIRTSVESGSLRRTLEGHPDWAMIARWLEGQIDLPGTIGSLTAQLTSISSALVQGSITQLLGTLLTFYILFYFLRDRRVLASFVRDLSPLSGVETDRFVVRVIDSVHATIYGTIAVAAVQGVLGGLMFWWLGLPGPLIWGVIMGLLAVVPVLGAFIVWIPAAVVLALGDRWPDALLLAFWGLVVIGGIDNLLYPVLVGNRLKLHSVPSLIAIIGGVSLFGAAGVIVGPMAVAGTAYLLEVWRTRASEVRLSG